MQVIEALADAFMHHEGWYAGSRSNRNRNPGNLRTVPGVISPKDAGGYRIFPTLAEGYKALCNDLRAKLNGSHGLTPDHSLLDLLNVYAPAGDNNNPSAYALNVANWLTIALGRPVLTSTTLAELK